MSLLSFLGVSDSLAAAAPHGGHEAGLMSMLPMLIIFVLAFYFLLIRPQNKRAKEHKKLVSELGKGDEVATSGGMLGKVIKVKDDFVVLQIAEGVEITVQKGAVSATLPKGTLKSV